MSLSPLRMFLCLVVVLSTMQVKANDQDIATFVGFAVPGLDLVTVSNVSALGGAQHGEFTHGGVNYDAYAHPDGSGGKVLLIKATSAVSLPTYFSALSGTPLADLQLAAPVFSYAAAGSGTLTLDPAVKSDLGVTDNTFEFTAGFKFKSGVTPSGNISGLLEDVGVPLAGHELAGDLPSMLLSAPAGTPDIDITLPLASLALPGQSGLSGSLRLVSAAAGTATVTVETAFTVSAGTTDVTVEDVVLTHSAGTTTISASIASPAISFPVTGLTPDSINVTGTITSASSSLTLTLAMTLASESLTFSHTFDGSDTTRNLSGAISFSNLLGFLGISNPGLSFLDGLTASNANIKDDEVTADVEESGGDSYSVGVFKEESDSSYNFALVGAQAVSLGSLVPVIQGSPLDEFSLASPTLIYVPSGNAASPSLPSNVPAGTTSPSSSGTAVAGDASFTGGLKNLLETAGLATTNIDLSFAAGATFLDAPATIPDLNIEIPLGAATLGLLSGTNSVLSIVSSAGAVTPKIETDISVNLGFSTFNFDDVQLTRGTGQTDIAATLTGLSEAFPIGGLTLESISLSGSKPDNGSLGLNAVGALKTASDAAITYTRSLTAANLPASLSGALTLSELSGLNLPALNSLTVNNVSYSDTETTGDVSHGGASYSISLFKTSGDPKNNIALSSSDTISLSSFVSGLAGTPIDQFGIDNPVIIYVPTGNALSPTLPVSLSGSSSPSSHGVAIEGASELSGDLKKLVESLGLLATGTSLDLAAAEALLTNPGSLPDFAFDIPLPDITLGTLTGTDVSLAVASVSGAVTTKVTADFSLDLGFTTVGLDDVMFTRSAAQTDISGTLTGLDVDFPVGGLSLKSVALGGSIPDAGSLDLTLSGAMKTAGDADVTYQRSMTDSSAPASLSGSLTFADLTGLSLPAFNTLSLTNISHKDNETSAELNFSGSDYTIGVFRSEGDPKNNVALKSADTVSVSTFVSGLTGTPFDAFGIKQPVIVFVPAGNAVSPTLPSSFSGTPSPSSTGVSFAGATDLSGELESLLNSIGVTPDNIPLGLYAPDAFLTNPGSSPDFNFEVPLPDITVESFSGENVVLQVASTSGVVSSKVTADFSLDLGFTVIDLDDVMFSRDAGKTDISGTLAGLNVAFPAGGLSLKSIDFSGAIPDVGSVDLTLTGAMITASDGDVTYQRSLTDSNAPASLSGSLTFADLTGLNLPALNSLTVNNVTYKDNETAADLTLDAKSYTIGVFKTSGDPNNNVALRSNETVSLSSFVSALSGTPFDDFGIKQPVIVYVPEGNAVNPTLPASFSGTASPSSTGVSFSGSTDLSGGLESLVTSIGLVPDDIPLAVFAPSAFLTNPGSSPDFSFSIPLGDITLGGLAGTGVVFNIASASGAVAAEVTADFTVDVGFTTAAIDNAVFTRGTGQTTFAGTLSGLNESIPFGDLSLKSVTLSGSIPDAGALVMNASGSLRASDNTEVTLQRSLTQADADTTVTGALTFAQLTGLSFPALNDITVTSILLGEDETSAQLQIDGDTYGVALFKTSGDPKNNVAITSDETLSLSSFVSALAGTPFDDFGIDNPTIIFVPEGNAVSPTLPSIIPGTVTSPSITGIAIGGTTDVTGELGSLLGSAGINTSNIPLNVAAPGDFLSNPASFPDMSFVIPLGTATVGAVTGANTVLTVASVNSAVSAKLETDLNIDVGPVNIPINDVVLTRGNSETGVAGTLTGLSLNVGLGTLETLNIGGTIPDSGSPDLTASGLIRLSDNSTINFSQGLTQANPPTTISGTMTFAQLSGLNFPALNAISVNSVTVSENETTASMTIDGDGYQVAIFKSAGDPKNNVALTSDQTISLSTFVAGLAGTPFDDIGIDDPTIVYIPAGNDPNPSLPAIIPGAVTSSVGGDFGVTMAGTAAFSGDARTILETAGIPPATINSLPLTATLPDSFMTNPVSLPDMELIFPLGAITFPGNPTFISTANNRLRFAIASGNPELGLLTDATVTLAGNTEEYASKLAVGQDADGKYVFLEGITNDTWFDAFSVTDLDVFTPGFTFRFGDKTAFTFEGTTNLVAGLDVSVAIELDTTGPVQVDGWRLSLLNADMPLGDIPGVSFLPVVDSIVSRITMRDIELSSDAVAGKVRIDSGDWYNGIVFKVNGNWNLAILRNNLKLPDLIPGLATNPILADFEFPQLSIMVASAPFDIEIGDLPQVAINGFSSFYGGDLGLKMKLPDGLGLLTLFDPLNLPDGTLKTAFQTLNLTNPLTFTGAIGGLFGGPPAVALSANLPTVTLPPLPDFVNLPSTYGTFFDISVEGADIGVGVSISAIFPMDLDGPSVNGDLIDIDGELAFRIDPLAGLEFAFEGELEETWPKSLGIAGLNLKPGSKFAIAVSPTGFSTLVDGYADIGTKSVNLVGSGSIILGIPSGGVGGSINSMTLTEIMNFTNSVVLAADPGADPIQTDFPTAKVTNVAIGFATLGTELPTYGIGPAGGIHIAGTLWIPENAASSAGNFSGTIMPTGLTATGAIAEFDVGAVSMRDSTLDINATVDIFNPPYFKLDGDITIMSTTSRGFLSLSLNRWEFELNQEFGDTFTYTFGAFLNGPEGADLAAVDLGMNAGLSLDKIEGWIKGDGLTFLTGRLNELSATTAQIAADISQAQSDVNSLNSQIDAQRAIVSAENQSNAQKLSAAQAEVARLNTAISNIDDDIDDEEDIIGASCNQTKKICVLWDFFGDCVQKVTVAHVTKRTACEAAKAPAVLRLAGLETEKGLLIAAKVSAEATLELLQDANNVIPVDADPRVASLIVSRDVALATLNALQAANAGVAGLTAAVSDTLEQFRAIMDNFSLSYGRVQGSLAKIIAGANTAGNIPRDPAGVIMELHYEVLGTPFKSFLAFDPFDPAYTIKQLEFIVLEIALEISRSGVQMPPGMSLFLQQDYIEKRDEVSDERDMVAADNSLDLDEVPEPPPGASDPGTCVVDCDPIAPPATLTADVYTTRDALFTGVFGSGYSVTEGQEYQEVVTGRLSYLALSDSFSSSSTFANPPSIAPNSGLLNKDGGFRIKYDTNGIGDGSCRRFSVHAQVSLADDDSGVKLVYQDNEQSSWGDSLSVGDIDNYDNDNVVVRFDAETAPYWAGIEIINNSVENGEFFRVYDLNNALIAEMPHGDFVRQSGVSIDGDTNDLTFFGVKTNFPIGKIEFNEDHSGGDDVGFRAVITAGPVSDLDADGLTDCQELALGTDPLDRNSDNDSQPDGADDFPNSDAAILDSDGDGQPDFWLDSCDLVCQFGSGLTLDTDDDNDGLGDVAEALRGTDPLNMDHDNDGVRDGRDAYPTLNVTSALGLADTDQDGVPDSCNANCDSNNVGVDIDVDGDGLIEIHNLAMLGHMANNLTGAFYADGTSATNLGCGGGRAGDEIRCKGYELAADINFDTDADGDLFDEFLWSGLPGWLPIGSGAAPFKANFEGNGHTISNLRVNRPGLNHVGLFGAIDAGHYIRNLTIDGDLTEVIGADHAAILVGQAASLDLDDVSVSGYVKGNNYVGLVVGQASDSTFDDVSAVGVVEASDYAGGLGGEISRTTGTSRIADSSVIGDVYGRDKTGGVAGAAELSTSMRTVHLTGHVRGAAQVGGLVGDATSASMQLDEVFAVGRVGGTSNVGGLVGDSLAVDLDLFYFIGLVGSDTANNVGGILGREAVGSTLREGFAAAEVVAASNGGAIVGSEQGISADEERVFWDATLTALGGFGNETGGVTTADLQKCVRNQGWGGDSGTCQSGNNTIFRQWENNDWDLGTPSQYPALRLNGQITRDLDEDGVWDAGDLDSDNDGIPDDTDPNPFDFDNDGVDDDQDNDTDNDWLPDALENDPLLGFKPRSKSTKRDADGDGIPDLRHDFDGDGISAFAETLLKLSYSKTTASTLPGYAHEVRQGKDKNNDDVTWLLVNKPASTSQGSIATSVQSDSASASADSPNKNNWYPYGNLTVTYTGLAPGENVDVELYIDFLDIGGTITGVALQDAAGTEYYPSVTVEPVSGADDKDKVSFTVTEGSFLDTNSDTTALTWTGAVYVDAEFEVSPGLVRLTDGGANQTLTVSNKGDLILAIGDGTDHTKINGASSTGVTCSASELAPGESCTMQVSHSNLGGSTSAVLEVLSDHPHQDTQGLSVLLTSAESKGQEAKRRLPPTMQAVRFLNSSDVEVTTLTAGETYTVSVDVLGYDDAFAIGGYVFSCSVNPDNSIDDVFCASNTSSALAGPLSDSNPTTADGNYTYGGLTSRLYTYEFDYTVSDSWNTDFDLVMRFFYAGPDDNASSGIGTSLLIPGGRGENTTVGQQGRKLRIEVTP